MSASEVVLSEAPVVSIHESKNSTRSDALFVVGLAMQKGAPFLLLPFWVSIVGGPTYASWVLLYATVQMFSTVLSLAVPNSVISFWFKERDKAALLGTISILTIFFTVVLGSGAYFLLRNIADEFGYGWSEFLLAVSLILLYIWNLLATQVARARFQGLRFFIAQMFSVTALLIGTVVLRENRTLVALGTVFGTSMLLQNAVMSFARPSRFNVRFQSRLAKQILSYSVPLLIHTELTLFMFWIDKYVMKTRFDALSFSGYTISFQYAFAESFFAQAIAMYCFPLICRYYAEDRNENIRMLLRNYNALLLILGGSWCAFILCVNTFLWDLHINSVGFAVLAAAFMLWNVCTNYINLMWAALLTFRVSMVIGASTFALLATLAAAVIVRSPLVAYAGHLIAAAVALLILSIMGSKLLSAKRELQRA